MTIFYFLSTLISVSIIRHFMLCRQVQNPYLVGGHILREKETNNSNPNMEDENGTKALPRNNTYSFLLKTEPEEPRLLPRNRVQP